MASAVEESEPMTCQETLKYTSEYLNAMQTENSNLKWVYKIKRNYGGLIDSKPD